MFDCIPGINPYCMTQKQIDMFSSALDKFNDRHWERVARQSREGEKRGLLARLMDSDGRRYDFPRFAPNSSRYSNAMTRENPIGWDKKGDVYMEGYCKRPTVPDEKFYNVKDYARAFKNVLLRECCDYTGPYWNPCNDRDAYTIYSSDVVFLAAAQKKCPEMLMQYFEAEKKVLQQNERAVAAIAKKHPEYAAQIMELRAKFLNLEQKHEEAQKLIWEKDCKTVKRLSGHEADVAVVQLMRDIPSEFLKEHFDVEAYWKGRGTELARNELAALKSDKSISPEFAQLKELLQRHPDVEVLVKSTYEPAFTNGANKMQAELNAKLKTLAEVQQRFGYDMTGQRETKEATLSTEDLQRRYMERA